MYHITRRPSLSPDVFGVELVQGLKYPGMVMRLLCPPRLNIFHTFFPRTASWSLLPHHSGTISSLSPCMDMNGTSGSIFSAAAHVPAHLSFMSSPSGIHEKSFCAISTHELSPPSATTPASAAATAGSGGSALRGARRASRRR